MNRVAQAQAEAVRVAFDCIPRRLHDKLDHDLFCSDPIFACVFAAPWDNEATADGRSYRRYKRHNAEWFDRLAAA